MENQKLPDNDGKRLLGQLAGEIGKSFLEITLDEKLEELEKVKKCLENLEKFQPKEGKMEIVKYNHHGVEVSVISELKGKHRDHCLCFRCKKFDFDPAKNCPIANLLFAVCIQCHITTPVYECKEFEIEEKKPQGG